MKKVKTKRAYVRRSLVVENPGDTTQAMFTGIIRAVKKAESLAAEGNSSEASKILINLSREGNHGYSPIYTLGSALQQLAQAQTGFKEIERRMVNTPVSSPEQY